MCFFLFQIEIVVEPGANVFIRTKMFLLNQSWIYQLRNVDGIMSMFFNVTCYSYSFKGRLHNMNTIEGKEKPYIYICTEAM